MEVEGGGRGTGQIFVGIPRVTAVWVEDRSAKQWEEGLGRIGNSKREEEEPRERDGKFQERGGRVQR